jgi:hypothetical protein
MAALKSPEAVTAAFEVIETSLLPTLMPESPNAPCPDVEIVAVELIWRLGEPCQKYTPAPSMTPEHVTIVVPGVEAVSLVHPPACANTGVASRACANASMGTEATSDERRSRSAGHR